VRPDLLEILRCPLCQNNRLNLVAHSQNEREVRTGEIRCEDCQASFPIVNGVVELLVGLDADTLKERNARQKQRDWGIERQRPFINDNPSQPWIWPAFAANVQQGLDLQPLRGKKVLDIGAATCWATRMMCERGATAVAVDISTSMLMDGESQFQQNIYFDRVAANMNILPFKDRSVEAIYFSAAIHHASDLQDVFKECARCLNDNGHVVLVNEPVRGKMRSNLNFGETDKAAGMNEHIFTIDDYQTAASSAGLRTEAFFPDSLRNQLAGKAPYPRTFGLFSARALWPLLQPFAERITIPLHRFLGIELVMVATK
jgi:SAM-dependent methyltransferase